jgi:hypothetical protein
MINVYWFFKQIMLNLHYCKTIPKGEDNNVFSTQHLILDIENNKLKFNII